MIKKGTIVTLIFIVSTLIQLISQIIVTRIFGARLTLDIFLAAVALPTTVVTVIYATLNDAFIPLLGERKQERDKADSYFLSHVLYITILSIIVSIVFGLFTDSISQLLYGDRGVMFVKSVAIQMKFMFLSFPLAVIATLFGSYFYSHKDFLRFPIAQAIGSAANVLIIILLAPTLGVWSLIVAFVLNIFVQILFVLPLTVSSFKLDRIQIQPLLFAWFPLILSAFAVRSDTLLMRSFAAGLPDGYLVYINLVSKMFSLATGIMTIGIQVLLLPHLVDYLVQKDYSRAIKNVNKAKAIAIGVSVMVTIALILVTPIAIKLLFIGGKFTSHDANLAISLIPFFVLPAVGWGISGVFFQPLIALKKQVPLLCINIVALVAGWFIGNLVKIQYGPLMGISTGLIILLFSGIIGSEFVWQLEKHKLIHHQSQS